MAFFGLFGKKQANPEDIDYLGIAADFESKGDFSSAINEYEKAILVIFANKPERNYRHITKKIVDCYAKLGNYEKVMEMWPSKYDSSDYGPREIYDLIKVLEAANRIDLVTKVYDSSGNKLLGNKVEFLIKQKRIPEAYALIDALIVNTSESNPAIVNLWLTKSKLCLSLRKWEEGCKYLNKILEKDSRNEEARKLKEFCLKQVRNS